MVCEWASLAHKLCCEQVSLARSPRRPVDNARGVPACSAHTHARTRTAARTHAPRRTQVLDAELALVVLHAVERHVGPAAVAVHDAEAVALGLPRKREHLLGLVGQLQHLCPLVSVRACACVCWCGGGVERGSGVPRAPTAWLPCTQLTPRAAQNPDGCTREPAIQTHDTTHADTPTHTPTQAHPHKHTHTSTHTHARTSMGMAFSRMLNSSKPV
jgi:hypothetical protein